MNLWQIRHIPNPWRNFLGFSAVIAFSLMAVWAIGLGIQSARGQGAAKLAAEKKGEPKPPDPAVIQAATEFMKKVHESIETHTSIKAEIEQTVSMGAEQFQVTGRYVSSGQKLRLEYTILPNQSVAGSLLKICDGKDLWSLLTVGETKRVTHRDIEQIKAAANATRNVRDVVLTAELGLGGMTALLASMERTMVFEAMKVEESDDGPRTVVQGKWKPEVAAYWPRNKEELLPTFVPDFVRIWVDNRTLFPVRISYIKRIIEKDKKVFRPMVTLKFRNVEFDAPINDEEFTFVNPPGVVPEDVTRQFLDRLKKTADNAAAQAAAQAAAAAAAKPVVVPGAPTTKPN